MDAMKLLRGRSMDQIREVSFEIGVLGRHGQDIRDVCSALAAGEDFLGAGKKRD